jgi:uncharacterized protein
MKIRLDSARVEPYRWEESIEILPSELGLEADEVGLSAVAVHGTLSWLSPHYLLQARLSYRQTVPCDRCLEPVGESVDLPLEWLVETRPAVAEDPAEQELAADDLGVVEVAGDELETRTLVLEQVQLNLPTHPLCREECAGLCPRCGRNLNLGACECRDRPADTRWAALAAWKNGAEGDGAGPSGAATRAAGNETEGGATRGRDES